MIVIYYEYFVAVFVFSDDWVDFGLLTTSHPELQPPPNAKRSARAHQYIGEHFKENKQAPSGDKPCQTLRILPRANLGPKLVNTQYLTVAEYLNKQGNSMKGGF